jgi:hypothetical protein
MPDGDQPGEAGDDVQADDATMAIRMLSMTSMYLLLR